MVVVDCVEVVFCIFYVIGFDVCLYDDLLLLVTLLVWFEVGGFIVLVIVWIDCLDLDDLCW